jgi:hypothetical protein
MHFTSLKKKTKFVVPGFSLSFDPRHKKKKKKKKA